MRLDSGATAWVLASAALVMLMTSALGFFYGCLVSRKNVLSTIMHSFFILCLISVQWVLWGYSLAFGPDKFHIIRGLEWIGLNNVGFTPNADYAPTIPHQAFMVLQMMFAVITPALISGAFAERQRFKAFVLFSLLWATFVYDPIAHWVWGAGGWLHQLGALDFAGGTVVHISSGVSALVAALVLGRRIGFGKQKAEPHDATMTVLGAALLWFGWFGLNSGSALGSGALATSAFVVTNTAAANGLFYGNPKQALIQLGAVGAAWGWSIVGTFAILKVVNLFVPLRVHEEEEILGLDLSQHGEPAYASIHPN